MRRRNFITTGILAAAAFPFISLEPRAQEPEPREDDSQNPNKVIGWAMYYGDGRRYTSADTKPEDLPKDGAQFRMLYFKGRNVSNKQRYREAQHGYDFYLFAPSRHGTIYASNSDTLKENKRRYPGATIIRGRWMEHASYDALVKRAFHERVF